MEELERAEEGYEGYLSVPGIDWTGGGKESMYVPDDQIPGKMMSLSQSSERILRLAKGSSDDRYWT